MFSTQGALCGATKAQTPETAEVAGGNRPAVEVAGAAHIAREWADEIDKEKPDEIRNK